MKSTLARSALLVLLTITSHYYVGGAEAQENLKPRAGVFVESPLFIFGWFRTDRTAQGYTSYRLAAYQAGLADQFEGTRVVVVKYLVYGNLNIPPSHIVEEEILPSETLTLTRSPSTGSVFTFKATLPETGVWDLTFYSGYGTAGGGGSAGDTVIRADPFYWIGVLEGTIDGKTPEMDAGTTWGGNATGRFLSNPSL